MAIYSFMFPRDPGDRRPGPATGQTALLPLAEVRARPVLRFLTRPTACGRARGPARQPRGRGEGATAAVLTFAAERGWRRLRMLSCAANTYNRDYLAETADGVQRPMLTVFHRDGDVIRHFWSSELFTHLLGNRIPGHVGTLEPVCESV